MTSLRRHIESYALTSYGTQPEYLWAKHPTYAVLRHPNKKWYAALLTVPRSKLGLEGNDPVDILNVKSDPILAGGFRQQPGILPGYHMNKEQWLSVLLDGTVPPEQLYLLLDLSYHAVEKKLKK